ncbi:MAG: hypothetical protein Q9195_006331 [Heterodermia aff. obscurata]
MLRNLSAFSEDVCICFTVKRLFDGGPGILGCDHQTWLADIQKSDTASVSYIALRSLAAAFFARMHGNLPSIMDQGAALYGQALRQLSIKINDKTACYDHALVSATMTLHLYETIMYSNRSGWIEHAGGTGRLIEMRGPERHQEFPDHMYFLLCRFRIIFRSLIERKRTFLEEEKWKTIPWAKYPETKNSMHYLQDILCDFPGFCQDRLDIDAAAARNEDVTAQWRTLEAKLIKSFRNLVRWRWQWDADNPDVVYEKPIDASSNLSVDSDGPLFDNVLHFKNLERATELVLYDITLQIFGHFYEDITKTSIYGPAMSVWPPVERPRPTNPLNLPSETLRSEDILSEICRSVEYHLHASHASSGAFALMFPLRICFAGLCILNKTREILWAIRLCETIADSTGFELARHMFSLKHLTSGQRINEVDNYVPLEVVALVESKEAEMLSR